MSLIIQNNNNKDVQNKQQALSIRQQQSNQIILGTERTSKLSAPILQLTGHKGEVFTVKFSPDGNSLASGSFDKEIFLWNVYGECINYAVLKGHKGSILELHWSTDGHEIYSACTDKSIGVWDTNQYTLIKRIREHNGHINSCCPARRGPPLIASASDDGTSRVFDTRTKGSIYTYKHKYPVTAVCFSDSSDQVITGSVDNQIRMWDLRNEEEPVMTLQGHSDTVTGLSLSPNGNYVLSNSMDNTVRQWDVRPYAPGNRCVGVFQGAQHNFEKTLLKCSWSSNSQYISAGSSDSMVYIWDVNTKKMLYSLPGHKGSVNQVEFHPVEPIIASASSDKTIFIGEIKP